MLQFVFLFPASRTKLGRNYSGFKRN